MRIRKKVPRDVPERTVEQITWFNKRFEEMKDGDEGESAEDKRVQKKHTGKRANTRNERQAVSVRREAVSPTDQTIWAFD